MSEVRTGLMVVACVGVLGAGALGGCGDETESSGSGGATTTTSSGGTTSSTTSSSSTTGMGGEGGFGEGGCLQYDMHCVCTCGSRVLDTWNCGSCQDDGQPCNEGGGGGTGGGGGSGGAGGSTLSWDCEVTESNCGC